MYGEQEEEVRQISPELDPWNWGGGLILQFEQQERCVLCPSFKDISIFVFLGL